MQGGKKACGQQNLGHVHGCGMRIVQPKAMEDAGLCEGRAGGEQGTTISAGLRRPSTKQEVNSDTIGGNKKKRRKKEKEHHVSSVVFHPPPQGRALPWPPSVPQLDTVSPRGHLSLEVRVGGGCHFPHAFLMKSRRKIAEREREKREGRGKRKQEARAPVVKSVCPAPHTHPLLAMKTESPLGGEG